MDIFTAADDDDDVLVCEDVMVYEGGMTQGGQNPLIYNSHLSDVVHSQCQGDGGGTQGFVEGNNSHLSNVVHLQCQGDGGGTQGLVGSNN